MLTAITVTPDLLGAALALFAVIIMAFGTLAAGSTTSA